MELVICRSWWEEGPFRGCVSGLTVLAIVLGPRLSGSITKKVSILI